jgi:hypothetical protein
MICKITERFGKVQRNNDPVTSEVEPITIRVYRRTGEIGNTKRERI